MAQYKINGQLKEADGVKLEGEDGQLKTLKEIVAGGGTLVKTGDSINAVYGGIITASKTLEELGIAPSVQAFTDVTAAVNPTTSNDAAFGKLAMTLAPDAKDGGGYVTRQVFVVVCVKQYTAKGIASGGSEFICVQTKRNAETGEILYIIGNALNKAPNVTNWTNTAFNAVGNDVKITGNANTVFWSSNSNGTTFAKHGNEYRVYQLNPSIADAYPEVINDA